MPQTESLPNFFLSLPPRAFDFSPNRGHEHPVISHVIHQGFEVLVVPGLGKIGQELGCDLVCARYVLLLHRGSGPIGGTDSITESLI